MSLPPDFIAELHKHFTGEIRLDPASRILYSTDASIYQIEPLGVALPKTQEDLHAAVELAAKYKIPVLPRGAGSSLAGQAIGEALVLDCSRWLDKLVDIAPEARTATVEPGLVLSTLNAAAAKYGLTFGPDPASAERATLGGVIGNNASGAHSILYGMTADHLVSADVILADGSLARFEESREKRVENGEKRVEGGDRYGALLSAALEIREKYAQAIRQGYPRSWRNSAGYRLNYLLPWSPSAPPQWRGERYPANLQPDTFNLAHLLAGSEGTLAVIRRATLKLVPKPPHTILGVLVYPSIAEACDDVPRLLEFQPSAVELVPQMLIRLAKGVPAYASQLGWIDGDPAAVLIVEFSGSRPEVLKEAASRLGGGVVVAESREDQARIWAVRKVGLGIFDSRPADARPVAFIEDCAIPVERLGEFVREIEKILAAHNTYAAFYAHASAGCLHIRPILDLKRGATDLRSIAEATLALTLRLGGSMSSEHGDGIARGEFLRAIYGAQVMEAMRLLKQAADPHNLLNPGKMLDAPPMDTHLRYGEGYTPQAWQAALDFGRNNGLAGAIEQCNGQGVCRKAGGVMCPSFQATREEGNSTRGRANLLRAMISWPMSLRATEGSEAISRLRNAAIEQAAFDALDLCLACKGCKSECPSGVDMAKLKYEFQHEYYKSHRRKLRDYLFAYIGPLARLGAPFGRLVNWGLGLGWVRRFANPLLGLAEERELPRLEVCRSTFQVLGSTQETTETVLLLRDTFTHFFEPEIELAALKVLAACGVEVRFLPYFGAGRTLISKGFLDAARRHAARVLDAVGRLDPDGRLSLLGIEPSELYTLRDEFLDLLPERRSEVEALAKRAWLVDEFLVRPDPSGQVRVLRAAKLSNENSTSAASNRQSKIHLHGHCYQKAQPPADDGFPVGQAASAEFLRAFGYEVEIIPSGCCGMAGAFGYEKEHYELSMQVGELVLFPYVRQNLPSPYGRGAGGEGKVAAPGASCRAQIADGTDATAEHPLVLAAQRLEANGRRV
jgi:FAD/FMN-containing dehydrogenase/Fe-S oxidoreductase